MQTGPLWTQVVAMALLAVGFPVSAGTSTLAQGNGGRIPEATTLPFLAGKQAATIDYALRFECPSRHEVDVGLVCTDGDQYTAEAWIRLDSAAVAGDYHGTIVGQHAAGEDAKGTLDINDGRLRFLLNTRLSSATETRHDSLKSIGSLPVGIWTHVAGVSDGSFMKVYINGIEEGRLPVAGLITQDNQGRSTRLGGYAGTAVWPAWFWGYMDEVRIWSIARTQDQLRTDMYHEILAQPGLIGYWRFDEGEGDTARDWSGNGHTGMLTNYMGYGKPTWVPGVFAQTDTATGTTRFSVSLDLDVSPGDQRCHSVFGVPPDSILLIQVFGDSIQDIVGFGARFEYDGSQLAYEAFSVGDAFLNAYSPGAVVGADPVYVEITAASLGSMAESSSGLLGTVFFRAMPSFSATVIRMPWIEVRRAGRFERQEVGVELKWRIAPSADFDGDGNVGFRDFLLFAEVFGSVEEDEKYDARFDLNLNGMIDFPDFLQFAEVYGRSAEDP